MSKHYNKEGVFVNTGFLRDHVSKLREQRKLASRLYENVAAMKCSSDPSLAYQYNSMLRDAEQLMEYFSRMSKVLADVDDEVVRLSHVLGDVIQDGTDEVRNASSGTYML